MGKKEEETARAATLNFHVTPLSGPIIELLAVDRVISDDGVFDRSKVAALATPNYLSKEKLPGDDRTLGVGPIYLLSAELRFHRNVTHRKANLILV